MELDLDIPDMEVPSFGARQVLVVRGLAGDRPTLTLDGIGLNVASVAVDGHDASFERDATTLTITFPGSPLRLGQVRTIEIHFTADFPTSDGLGFNWSLPDPGGDSETDRFAQIHTQGQARGSREWFFCHDAPNERLATTIQVAVAEPYVVISNGRLAEREPLADGRVRWRWEQARPHPAYLVSLVVGVFDRVVLAGPELPEGERSATSVPMVAYGPVGTAGNMRRVFEGTPDMLAFFERWLDEPYPWDRYDQVCVREFHSGGMENTAATTLYEDCARSTRALQEDLISHELVHMWFGDLITCRTWDHLWLNEGWATYGEVLWREERARVLAEQDGLDPGDVEREREAAMLEYMLQLVRVQRRFNRARAPHDPALVSNLYQDPETVFERADDAYNKGAAVLHMLRTTLGDELFQAGTRLYVDRHKDGLVETDDLRLAFEDVSGSSLERFFTQWALRPGLPRLRVTLQWIEEDQHLLARVEQTQRIDADNPAYAFDLPLRLRVGRQTIETSVRVDRREQEVRIALQGRPDGAEVDPRLSVFADTRVEKDLAWWRNELDAGTTIVARTRAAEAVAAHPRADAADLLRLASIAGDVSVRSSLREAATLGVATLTARAIGADLLPLASISPLAQPTSGASQTTRQEDGL